LETGARDQSESPWGYHIVRRGSRERARAHGKAEIDTHETQHFACHARDLLNKMGDALKKIGNKAYAAKDYATAIDYFTQAIELEPENPKYYLNRSLCHAGLRNWKQSALDARSALNLDIKYAKAHCRLIKALFELGLHRDARTALLIAFKECEETADLKALDQTLTDATGTPSKPRSNDFEVVSELGDGNFSKVYKVYHKGTKVEFALKVCSILSLLLLGTTFLYDINHFQAIERARIDRMKKRHPNIHNEILMEKRVSVQSSRLH
jgi:tetratricopeptide (TPR) repeat protein